MAIALVAGFALSGQTARAADSSVCGDIADIQAAIDDAGTVAGDTISLCAGVFAGPGTVHINKSVTIEGAGVGATSVQPTGVGFYVDADDVTVRDLTVANGSQAIRFEIAGGTIDGTTLLRVQSLNNSSRGIEIHNATTVTNLLIDQSNFTNSGTGLRVSSSGHLNGATIQGSVYEGNSIGFYMANDGGSSTMADLTIIDSRFVDNSSYGIFIEEVQNATITQNTFIGNRRDIQIFKWYQAALPVSNVNITGNSMSGTTDAVFAIFNAHHLGGQTEFAGVNFSQNVASGIQRSAVYAGGHSSYQNAPVSLGGIGWETVAVQCNAFEGIPVGGGEGVRLWDPVAVDGDTLGGASLDVTNNWWGTDVAADVEDLMHLPVITDFDPILAAAPSPSCPVILVAIDVKPGNKKNCFNPNGHGVVPVAVLGSADFDVTEIDPATLLFGPFEVRSRGKKGLKCKIKDVNHDGFDDYICKFEDNGEWDENQTATATLVGQTFGGASFEGTDAICIAPKHGKHGKHQAENDEENEDD